MIGIDSCLEHLTRGDASTGDVVIEHRDAKATADMQQTALMAYGTRYGLRKDDSGIPIQTKRMLKPENSHPNRGLMIVNILVSFICSFLIQSKLIRAFLHYRSAYNCEKGVNLSGTGCKEIKWDKGT